MLERSVRDAREHRIGCVLIDHARRVRRQRAVKRLQCRIHCGYGKALHLAPPGFDIGNRRSAEVPGPVGFASKSREVGGLTSDDRWRLMNRCPDEIWLQKEHSAVLGG